MKRKNEYFDEGEFIELRTGAIEELQTKFHEQEKLIQYYKTQFEIERFKRIKLELEHIIKKLPQPVPPVTSKDGETGQEQVREATPTVLDAGVNLGASSELTSRTTTEPRRKNKGRNVDAPDTPQIKESTSSSESNLEIPHSRAPDSRDEFGNVEYNCICGYSDLREQKLKTHLRSVKCNMCGCLFNTLSQLKKHKRNVHLR